VNILFPYPRQFGFNTIAYEYVTALRESGLQVSYVGQRDAEQDITSADQSFHTHGPDTNNLDFARFASKRIAEVKPDIVHVFHFRGSGLLALANGALSDVKWVMDVRTLHVQNKKYRQDPFFPLKDRITWLEAQAYDHILVGTEKIKRRMLPSRRPVEIVPIGASWERLNMENCSALRNRTRSQFDIPQGAPVILYTGSLSPARKLHRVVAAFSRILRQFPEARLVMVGGQMGVSPEADGFVQVLKRQADELGITGNISFTGRIPYPDVAPFYAMSDIGVFHVPLRTPYRYQPALKAIEYMMAGLVAVCSRTPAISELVIDGTNGLLCGDKVEQISDGLCRALELLRPENRQRLQRLIAVARSSVRELDWRVIVRDRIIPLYAHLDSLGKSAP
jgi:1,2-diacylglycerol 3-alpha-glucosyltransferase